MTTSLTLGQQIKTKHHTFSIKNDAGEKVQLSVWIDFTTATDLDITGWLISNRIIAGQRPWRALSMDELKALDGVTILATEIGRKVKSRAEKIATYTSMGLTDAFAIMAVDQPAKFQAMMEQVDAMSTEDEDEDPEL